MASTTEKATTWGTSALDKNKMMQEGWAGKKVRDLMTTRLETCSETDTLQIAAGKMKSSSVGCLGVLSNNQIIGVLTDRDIVTRCLAEGKAYQTTKVGECMTRGAVTVSPDDTMELAHQKMNQQNIRRLVVFDKSSNKFGLISKSDMMCSNKA